MGYEAWEPDADERAEASASWGLCECCFKTLHWSDFTDPDEDAVVEALVAKHGGPVCNLCADEHMICDGCDTPQADCTGTLHDGWLCPDCNAATPEARAEARADERAAIFMETR